MSYYPEDIAPASSDSPPRSRHRVRKTIGFGCLGLLILAVIAAVMLARVWRQGQNEITPVVENFLDLAEDGRFEEAYSQVDENWRTAQSVEQFRSFYSYMARTLGARKTLNGVRHHQGTSTHAGRTANAVYNATYENGDATLYFVLKKADGVWRIVSCRYSSPLFDDSLVCEACNAYNRADARYCSQCGAPLVPESETLDNPE